LPTITGFGDRYRDWREPGTLLGLALLAGWTILELVQILLLAAVAADPATIVLSDFALKPTARSRRITPDDCRRTVAAGEIVICGRNPDQHRVTELKPPKGIEIDEPGVIGLNIGGARVEPGLEQVGMPDGRISKRIMIKVKVPF
jgi:hypothetical protein